MHIKKMDYETLKHTTRMGIALLTTIVIVGFGILVIAVLL